VRVLACIAWVACASSTVWADDDDDGQPLPEVPDPPANEEAPPEDGSWLKLDPLFLPPQLEGLSGADVEREGVTFRLGRGTAARFEGSWWQNEDGALSGTKFRDAAIDVPSLGWRAAAELTHDFGFAELVVGTSISGIESRYGRGKYLTTGVALRKKWKLSRWTTLWIQLGAGVQSWVGEPPPGQKNARVFGLSIGGTFR
jgi:hypothetical protein